MRNENYGERMELGWEPHIIPGENLEKYEGSGSYGRNHSQNLGSSRSHGQNLGNSRHYSWDLGNRRSQNQDIRSARSHGQDFRIGRNQKVSGQRPGWTGEIHHTRAFPKHRRGRGRQRVRRFFGILLVCCLFLAVVPSAWRMFQQLGGWQVSQAREFLDALKASDGKDGLSQEDYQQELLDLLEKNEETYDFVSGYPEREDYRGKAIDLSADYEPGKVPLLMQWDRRWGYDSYGDDMIGLAGCGPTCMTMAYLYLTGDTSVNPRTMAEYAYNQGYDTEAGTSWSFFTEGAAGLNLDGSELPLSEGSIKNALDQGEVVICSMGPGDFTTVGHFILLRGYDGNGFYVNDPNRRANSEKQWDYDTLSSQMKCLWRIGI